MSIEHRTFSGVIISMDWTLGNWILVGFAYFVNEWRMLILAVTSPLILSIIAWRYKVSYLSYSEQLNPLRCLWDEIAVFVSSGGFQSLQGGSQRMGRQKQLIITSWNVPRWITDPRVWLTSHRRYRSHHCFYLSNWHAHSEVGRGISRVVCVCVYSQTLLDSAETETRQKYTFLDLFRTPNIRKISIYSGIVW